MAIDKFLIEASHIMMFARSIGDDNPIYYDQDYKSDSGCEGIITSAEESKVIKKKIKK